MASRVARGPAGKALACVNIQRTAISVSELISEKLAGSVYPLHGLGAPSEIGMVFAGRNSVAVFSQLQRDGLLRVASGYFERGACCPLGLWLSSLQFVFRKPVVA